MTAPSLAARWSCGGDLPDQPIAPSDAPLEPTVSPIFIHHPVYSARCSTVVAVDVQGQGLIVERRFDAEGGITGETTLSFAWPA